MWTLDLFTNPNSWIPNSLDKTNLTLKITPSSFRVVLWFIPVPFKDTQCPEDVQTPGNTLRRGRKKIEVCDITCDADGSVPTRQFASIEQPFHILNVTWCIQKKPRGESIALGDSLEMVGRLFVVFVLGGVSISWNVGQGFVSPCSLETLQSLVLKLNKSAISHFAHTLDDWQN